MAAKFANNAVSKFAGGVGTGALTFSITPGDGAKFPALSGSDWFPLTAIKANGSREIMRVTGRATDTLTVVRAQESTAALTFISGEVVELRFTAAAIEAIKADAVLTAMPIGAVVLWDGDINAIPAGWHLCDGTGGTRDMRNMLPIGAGSTYAIGDTAGSASVNSGSSGAHSHGVTVDTAGAHNHGGTTGSTALTLPQIPSHTHGVKAGFNDTAHGAFVNSDSVNDAGLVQTEAAGGGQGHTHTISGDTGHVHTAHTDNASTHVHSVALLPPVLALAYIKKVS